MFLLNNYGKSTCLEQMCNATGINSSWLRNKMRWGKLELDDDQIKAIQQWTDKKIRELVKIKVLIDKYN